jgi:hypothetical protein
VPIATDTDLSIISYCIDSLIPNPGDHETRAVRALSMNPHVGTNQVPVSQYPNRLKPYTTDDLRLLS